MLDHQEAPTGPDSDLESPTTPPSLQRRAARAMVTLTSRGPSYFLHKTLRRALSPWPTWKRRLVYSNPKQYWLHRGGEEYFLEQEGQADRTRRSLWLAERIARYQPTSILEIGCGYGKQLRALRRHLDCPMVGVDFSQSQLDLGHSYLQGLEDIELIHGSGRKLPFADRSFDLVLTSAVILHNPPAEAEAIRREVIRIARRYAAHNEDTTTTYNRYGYDTAAWYRKQGITLVEVRQIPIGSDSEHSQFCVAEL